MDHRRRELWYAAAIMGRIASVNCNCPDRRPVDESRPWSDEYVCGHANGQLLELSAFWITKVSEALRKTFEDSPDFANTCEVFRKIADEELYENEVLEVSATERELWWLELDEVEKLDRGTTRLPHRLVQRWRKSWPPTSHDGPQQSLGQVLNAVRQLCETSRKTAQPIEFAL